MPRKRQPPPATMPPHPTVHTHRSSSDDDSDDYMEGDDSFTGQLHKSNMATRASTGKKERRSRSRERRPAIEARRQRFADYQGDGGGRQGKTRKGKTQSTGNASSSSSSTPPRQRGSSGGSSSDNISPGRSSTRSRRRSTHNRRHSRTPSPGSSRMESARAHALRIRVLHEREEWRQHYPPGWPEYLHTDELVYQLNQLEVAFDATQPRKKLLRLLVQTARRNAAESAKHHAVHARIHLIQPAAGVQLMPTWAPGSKLVVRVCLVYAGKVEDAVRRSAAASNRVEDVMADYWHTLSQTPADPHEADAFLSASPFRDAAGGAGGGGGVEAGKSGSGGGQWFAVDALPGSGTAAVPAIVATGASAGTGAAAPPPTPPPSSGHAAAEPGSSLGPGGGMGTLPPSLERYVARFDIGQKKDLRLKFELWLKGYLWNTLLGVTEKYLLPLPQYYIGSEAALQETLPIEAPADGGGGGGADSGGGGSLAPQRKELARICFSTFFEQIAPPADESPLPSPCMGSEGLEQRGTAGGGKGPFAFTVPAERPSNGSATPRAESGKGKKGKGKKGKERGMTSKVLLDIADMTIEHESAQANGQTGGRNRQKRPSGKNTGGQY